MSNQDTFKKGSVELLVLALLQKVICMDIRFRSLLKNVRETS